MKKTLPWIAVVVIVAAVAAVYVFYPRAPAPQPTPQPAEKPEAAVPQPTIVRPPAEPPLPGLDESDAAVAEWLNGVIGPAAVESFLVPASLVRKLVATVDNLPRKKLDVRVRVVRSLDGQFPVERRGDDMFLGPAAYARYEPFIQVVSTADVDKVAGLYVRLYPLLQEAYEELGYPGREFHARVLEAIDDLLAAPEIEQPVQLAQPHVFYEFADPALESRSAGQKIMMRIGPQNAALVKEKLIALRAAIVARSTSGSGGENPPS